LHIRIQIDSRDLTKIAFQFLPCDQFPGLSVLRIDGNLFRGQHNQVWFSIQIKIGNLEIFDFRSERRRKYKGTCSSKFHRTRFLWGGPIDGLIERRGKIMNHKLQRVLFHASTITFDEIFRNQHISNNACVAEYYIPLTVLDCSQ